MLGARCSTVTTTGAPRRSIDSTARTPHAKQPKHGISRAIMMRFRMDSRSHFGLPRRKKHCTRRLRAGAAASPLPAPSEAQQARTRQQQRAGLGRVAAHVTDQHVEGSSRAHLLQALLPQTRATDKGDGHPAPHADDAEIGARGSEGFPDKIGPIRCRPPMSCLAWPYTAGTILWYGGPKMCTRKSS